MTQGFLYLQSSPVALLAFSNNPLKRPFKSSNDCIPLNLDMPCLCKQCRSRSVGTHLDPHCLSLSMWICINYWDQVIWLAENQKWVWYLNLFSMTRMKYSYTQMQCKPISDTAECGIWSGSALFATHSVF